MTDKCWRQSLRRLSFSSGIASVMALVGGSVLAGPDGFGAPYPKSEFLPSFEVDWSTLRRDAAESDLFPMTWADDGSVYTMWGDGGGFGEGAIKESYVSIGLARLKGERAGTITGENLIGGARPSVAPCFAPAGGKTESRDKLGARGTCTDKGLHGKSASMLAMDGDLYTFISPGGGLGPYEEARLYKAPAGTNKWRRADWAFGGKPADGRLTMPAFLQAGRGYRDKSDYVYAYGARLAPRSTDSGLDLQDGPNGGEIALLRAPRNADLMQRGSWDYFAGLGKDNAPQWSGSPDEITPVIRDKNGVGWTTSAIYVKQLKRYLVATEHGMHGGTNLTLLEFPNPWGPWKTVAYKKLADPQGRIDTRGFYFNFAPQSLSEDGKEFTLAWTGGGNADAMIMIDGRFETGKDDGETPPEGPVTEPPGEEDIAAATDTMMRRVMASRLSHRAALVDGVELNRWTQTRRQQEVEEGLAASMAALPESERLGFTAFAVGNSALPEDDDSDKAQTDIGRAQFTQAFADDADDGGAGVTYRLDETTSVGIAITSYSDTSSSESGDIASSSYLASRGASAFLQHGMGMLQLQTRFAYSHDRHEQVESDQMFDSQDRVSFKGRSMELAQRVGVPVKRDRMVVTPWAELGYESQAADGFSVGEGVTEQTYGDVEVSDMLASFGIDTSLEPLALGERALLTLRGGLSYTHGLRQDDYEVEVEQAGLGSQQETIDRPTVQTVGLTLGGTLGLSEALAVDAGVLLQHDLEAGASQSARVGVSWRF